MAEIPVGPYSTAFLLQGDLLQRLEQTIASKNLKSWQRAFFQLKNLIKQGWFTAEAAQLIMVALLWHIEDNITESEHSNNSDEESSSV